MMKFLPQRLSGPLFAAALALLSQPAAAQLDPGALCAVHTAEQERLHHIPKFLLGAISIVESGRWDAERKVGVAWPWTVMAEGKGRFLPSKQAAIAEVQELQRRGVKNIDVGCMQVNLLWHPEAFDSLEEAFDPAANTGYAARFLKSLHASTQDWTLAGSYYHSQTPANAARYRGKLVEAWENAKMSPGGNLADTRSPPEWTSLKPLPGRERQPAQTPTQADRERAEAKRIADAWRKAKTEEYLLQRKQRQEKVKQ